VNVNRRQVFENFFFPKIKVTEQIKNFVFAEKVRRPNVEAVSWPNHCSFKHGQQTFASSDNEFHQYQPLSSLMS
jgi:hypothetical protein